MVTWPDLPFSVAVVVPEAVPEFRTRPAPAADATKFPVVAVMLPVVAVKPVAEVVVPANDGEDGTEKVIVLPDPVVVIWFAVPASVMLFAEGLIAPPVPPVSVLRAPPSLSRRVHVGVVMPADVVRDVSLYTVLDSVLIHSWPICHDGDQIVPGLT